MKQLQKYCPILDATAVLHQRVTFRKGQLLVIFYDDFLETL